MTLTLFDFLSGAVSFGFLISGVFFLRFWRRTGDALFLSFAVAFWLLGFAQALLALADIPQESRSWVYVIRLIAFAVILAAIVRKNRPSG